MRMEDMLGCEKSTRTTWSNDDMRVFVRCARVSGYYILFNMKNKI